MKKFCKKYGITEDQFYGRTKFIGDLDLSRVRKVPTGFNPHVIGDLLLCNIKNIHEGFAPIVSGDLDLKKLEFIPVGFRPVVGGSMMLDSIVNIPELFYPIVGKHLYLDNVLFIPTNFKPVVGLSLELSKLQYIQEGFCPTVGGNLFLYGIKKLPEWFRPNIGCMVVLCDGVNRNFNQLPLDYMFSWCDGKYIMVDGVFVEVMYHDVMNNIYHVMELGSDDVTYVVGYGDGNFAYRKLISLTVREYIGKEGIHVQRGNGTPYMVGNGR